MSLTLADPLIPFVRQRHRTVSEAQIQAVVAGARNPLNWLARAEGHIKAAELLAAAWLETSRKLRRRIVLTMAGFLDADEQEPGEIDLFDESLGYAQGAMLHQCLAVENLLKGLLVSQEPERWVKASSRRMFTWGHDLRKLANDAGIGLTPAEDARIDSMSRFIDWGGRYPTALTPSDHGDGVSWSQADVEVAARLAKQLQRALRLASGMNS